MSKELYISPSFSDLVKKVAEPLKPPTILTPSIGDEISNLNPILTISHTEAEDDLVGEVYGGAGQNTSGTPRPVAGVPLDQNGIWYLVDSEENNGWWKGRLYELEFWIVQKGTTSTTRVSLGPTDVRIEVRKATYTYTNVSIEPEVECEGYLDENGHFYIPYDSQDHHYNFFAVKLSTNRTDIALGVSTPNNQTELSLSEIFFMRSFGDWTGWTETTSDGINHTIDGQNGWFVSDYSASVDVPWLRYRLVSGHQLDVSYEYDISFDNGSSWERLPIYAKGQTTVQLDMTPYLDRGIETYQARLRVRGKDNNSYWATTYHARTDNYSPYAELDGVFTVIKHIPPNKPTNLKISDTGIVDKNIVNRLSWKYTQNSMNNRQGKALVQWRKQGETVWNDILVEGMNQFYDVPENTFPLGVIEWQVKTYNYVDMESPFSDIVTFTAKDTPIGPTIVAPSSEVNEPSPSVIWQHDYIQTHYEVQVLNLSDIVEWTSGEVESTDIASRISKYLGNITTYKLMVRVKTNEGLWTDWTIKLFDTNYQYPAPASVSATAKNGYITVSYDNPIPTGEQPFVARNEVYKMIDQEWVKISDASPHSFDDYAAANGTTNYYFVRSIASNGAYTDSEVKSAIISITGVLLYLVNDPEGTVKQFRRILSRQNEWTIESSSMRFKGRKGIVKEIGTIEENTISFSLILNEDEKRALDKIVYSGHVACYRDGAGRLGYVIFDHYPLVDRADGQYEVEFELEKIDYVEGTTLVEDDGITTIVIDGGEV